MREVMLRQGNLGVTGLSRSRSAEDKDQDVAAAEAGEEPGDVRPCSMTPRQAAGSRLSSRIWAQSILKKASGESKRHE